MASVVLPLAHLGIIDFDSNSFSDDVIRIVKLNDSGKNSP